MSVESVSIGVVADGPWCTGRMGLRVLDSWFTYGKDLLIGGVSINPGDPCLYMYVCLCIP